MITLSIIIRTFVSFFLIVCALLLTSCASHQKYPVAWSPLIPVEDNKCPDISGTYAIEGERIIAEKNTESEPEADTDRNALAGARVDNKIRPLYLYEVFPMKYFFSRGPTTKATYVQISQPDNETFEISYLNNEGLIDKKIYSLKKKEYACSPKGIKITNSWDEFLPVLKFLPVPIGVVGGAWVWGKYYLAKSIDGSLIIKEEGTAVVYIIFPVWKDYEIWYRFKEIQK